MFLFFVNTEWLPALKKGTSEACNPPGCSTNARGTTPPLSFQEGYRWGPFPAGGSRYPFVVPPERHIAVYL